MASATRLATDNYNLQVELTLQRHASQFMLSQMHEQQLQLMAKEEELEVSVRAAGRSTGNGEPVSSWSGWGANGAAAGHIRPPYLPKGSAQAWVLHHGATSQKPPPHR